MQFIKIVFVLVLILPKLSYGEIYSGSGIMNEVGNIMVGPIKIPYSRMSSEYAGYLYGKGFENVSSTVFFADVTDSSPCGSNHHGHNGIGNICDFKSASNYKFTAPSSILIGDQASICYQGIVLFNSNGIYGAIDPKDVSDSVLHYDYWYDDSGASDFSSLCAPQIPKNCFVEISPNENVLQEGENKQFDAISTGDNCVPGNYNWAVYSNIGSEINSSGLYTAGYGDGVVERVDVISVVDTSNENITDTALVTVVGESPPPTIKPSRNFIMFMYPHQASTTLNFYKDGTFKAYLLGGEEGLGEWYSFLFRFSASYTIDSDYDYLYFSISGFMFPGFIFGSGRADFFMEPPIEFWFFGFEQFYRE